MRSSNARKKSPRASKLKTFELQLPELSRNKDLNIALGQYPYTSVQDASKFPEHSRQSQMHPTKPTHLADYVSKLTEQRQKFQDSKMTVP